VHAFPSLQAVPFVATGFEHVPVAGLHVPTSWHWSEAVHVTPAQRLVPPPSDPNPSWHVTVAPEFISTCAAASAPVNFDVFTVTRALVATKSASICAPEFRLIPDDVSKYRTSALAVSPDPEAGPVYDPLLKLAAPVTESVVGLLAASVPPLFSVRDAKT
jgi:hypothetical protein